VCLSVCVSVETYVYEREDVDFFQLLSAFTQTHTYHTHTHTHLYINTHTHTFVNTQDYLRGLELGKDTMEKVVEAGDVRGLKELLLRGTHIKGMFFTHTHTHIYIYI
jgi:hypothetical protein